MLSSLFGDPARPAPRPPRQVKLSWDNLEGRTVPAHMGGGLHHLARHVHHHVSSTTGSSGATTTVTTAASTSDTTSGSTTSGGTTSSSTTAGGSTTGGTTSCGTNSGSTTSSSLITSAASSNDSTVGTTSSQLSTDIQQLRTDIRSIESLSGVTLADLTAFRSDLRALAQSGLKSDQEAFETFAEDLLSAVAAARTDGSSNPTLTDAQTTTLQAELGTAFGTTVADSTQLAQLYGDMLKIAQDSNITTANITTIADDQAKIKADLASSSGSSTSTPDDGEGCVGGGHGGGGERGDQGAARVANASVASLLIPGF
jgi:hypothetical protein